MNPIAIGAALILAGNTAAADFLCETTDGTIRYAIDTRAQTIAVNDLPPIGYTIAAQPLRALAGVVWADVDLPSAPQILLIQPGFMLRFETSDTIFLTDSFSASLPDAPMSPGQLNFYGAPCQEAP